MRYSIGLTSVLASTILGSTVSADAEPTIDLSDTPRASTSPIAATARHAPSDDRTEIAPLPRSASPDHRAFDVGDRSAQDLSDWLAHYAPYLGRQEMEAAEPAGR